MLTKSLNAKIYGQTNEADIVKCLKKKKKESLVETIVIDSDENFLCSR